METTTDNINRTVANIRSSFTKCGGSLGTQGMLDFIFTRKSVFKIAAKPDIDLEELEFDLIDLGGDEVFLDEEGFDLLIDKIDIGGYIIADNVLWSGKVTNEKMDTETLALDEYNKKTLAEPRVENILLPVRDGLMISRKIK